MAVNKLDPKIIFASEAPAQDVPAVFTNKTVGWGESRKNGGRPTIKQSNALQQETDLKILWLNENAVTPYDASIDYPTNAVTIKDGAFKIFNGSVWNIFLTKSSVGLGNVDNTSDLNKPISTATQSALNGKASISSVASLQASLALKADLSLVKRGIGNTYDSTLTYNENERVILLNGDTVQSTISSNTNNPNTNMSGWVVISVKNPISTVESIADLIAIQNPKNGQVVYVKSYYSGLNAGGRKLAYDSSKAGINDGVFIFNGWVSERIVELTPEHAGAKANSWEFDNKDILNKVFATGQDIYSTPDKIYTCNGNLKTLGQKCMGGWKIRSSKPTVGTPDWTNTSNTYADPCDFTYLQGVYFAYAYDLSELLAVRELGYNTLLHYGGMHISGYDNDGGVQNLLDNAKTAGLQVLLGTQNSLNGMSLPDFVNLYKDHPALLGFLIADEPRHNGMSIADQQAKINTMKGLTNKPLACSDFTYDAFTEVLADGYDYIFGDIYNDVGETAEQTLYKMRVWLGLTTKRHPNSKILPAVMGFKYNGGVDLETIISTSKVFAKSCGGNFSCFGWDVLGESSISNGIRDTVSLQKLSKDICSYKTGVYKIPECYAWGAVTEQASQVNYGLNDVIETYVRSDPYSTGIYEGVNCYPAQMNGATVDGERTSVSIATGQAISGIWFKHTFGAFISDIKMKKKNHFTVQSGMLAKGSADVILAVRGSSVGGYGLGSVLASLPDNLSISAVTFDNNSTTDTFCIKYDSSADPQFYRTFVRGVYVTSDW